MIIQRHQELLRVAIAARKVLPLLSTLEQHDPRIQELIVADQVLRETENDLMASYLMEGGSYLERDKGVDSDVDT